MTFADDSLKVEKMGGEQVRTLQGSPTAAGRLPCVPAFYTTMMPKTLRLRNARRNIGANR
jgi:hypothetical protein